MIGRNVWVLSLLWLTSSASAQSAGEREQMWGFCEGLHEQTSAHEGDCEALGDALVSHIEAHRATLDWVHERTGELGEDPEWNKVLGHCVEGFASIPQACWEHPRVRDAMNSLAGEEAPREVAPERAEAHQALGLFCTELQTLASQPEADCAVLSQSFTSLTQGHTEAVAFLRSSGMDSFPEEEEWLWLEAIEPCVMGLVSISMGACGEDAEMLEALDGLGELAF